MNLSGKVVLFVLFFAFIPVCLFSATWTCKTTWSEGYVGDVLSYVIGVECTLSPDLDTMFFPWDGYPTWYDYSTRQYHPGGLSLINALQMSAGIDKDNDDYIDCFRRKNASLIDFYPLTITSEFYEISPLRDGPHTGVDIAGTTGGLICGATVYPASDGTFLGHGTDAERGNWVQVQGNDGMISEYNHLQDNIVPGNLKAGNRVYAGLTCLGKVGSTGHSTGCHLDLKIFLILSVTGSDTLNDLLPDWIVNLPNYDKIIKKQALSQYTVFIDPTLKIGTKGC